MSSTSSRVLRTDELSSVAPVWWHDVHTPPPPPPPPEEPVEEVNPVDLERERAAIEQAAYQRGFLDGQKTGKEQAAAEVHPVMDRMVRSLTELASLRTKLRKDAEGDLLKLSIAVARRILHRELTLDPESIEGLIRAGLVKLEARELSRVRVHPSQEKAVRAALDRSREMQKVELSADPLLQPGDVLFETPHGTLDASIETQLREIDRGFADRLRK